MDGTTAVLELGIVDLSAWIVKKFEILCVVDFCQFSRGYVEHAFADKAAVSCHISYDLLKPR